MVVGGVTSAVTAGILKGAGGGGPKFAPALAGASGSGENATVRAAVQPAVRAGTGAGANELARRMAENSEAQRQQQEEARQAAADQQQETARVQAEAEREAELRRLGQDEAQGKYLPQQARAGELYQIETGRKLNPGDHIADDFIEGQKKWDAIGPIPDNIPAGRFNVRNFITSLQKKLMYGKNVIVDVRGLTGDQIKEVRKFIASQNLPDGRIHLQPEGWNNVPLY